VHSLGTPKEIAEEGYRICRINAELREEVERLKKNAVPTHSSAASASTSSATTTTTTTTPGISTDGTTTTATATNKATMRALKNRVAVMEDALAEMRSEAPKLREVTAWMWDIIGEYRGVYVPRQLRDLYHETMIVDAEDWQAKKKSGRWGGGMQETDTYFGGAYEDRGRRGDRYDGRNGGGDGGAGEERRGGMKKGKDEDEDEDKEKFLKAENVAAGGKRKGTSRPPARETKKFKIEEEGF
jgi:hypothetical protein